MNERPHVNEAQRKVHADLFRIAGILQGALLVCWAERAEHPALEEALNVTLEDLLPLGSHARSPTASVLMGAIPPSRYLWLREAEDFVALRISTFIYQVFA